jgi:hypothetical protein
VKPGTVFRAWAQKWRLVRAERGRRGEARTMYLIRREDGHEETRARATVVAQIAAERGRK